jgi:TonB-dependent starch-binding outer membrane protein SusC
MPKFLLEPISKILYKELVIPAPEPESHFKKTSSRSRIKSAMTVRFLRCIHIVFCCVSLTAFSQDRLVSGRVTSVSDPNGLPGVNVVVKGTSNGIITDLNGKFTLETPVGSTLVFSFIGYKTQEVAYVGQADISLILEEEPRELSEVVVVGYSSVERRDIIGSVTSIKADKFREISLNGIDQALQGQAPGVQVVQSSGTPGGGITVRIRGNTSISASNRPLFIIDGVPVETGSLSLRDFGGQDDNALSSVNPNDIESIQVLKDASAKAMYGSRGANGVVLIHTKKGNKSLTRINFDMQRGIVDPVKKLPLLNSTQLLQLQREAITNAGKDPDKAGLTPGVTDAINTDWLDAVFRRGIVQQYQLSASGGDESTTYYLSAGYRDEEGVQLNNRFRRFSTSLNVERKFSPKLTVGNNLTLAYSINNRIKGDNFLDGVYSGALKSLPYHTPYDEYGNIVGARSPLYAGFPNFNPVGQALLPRFVASTVKVLGNINATYRFSEELSLRSQAGLDYNDVTEDQYESSQTAIGGFLSNVGGQGYGVFSASKSASFIVNSVLSYKRKIYNNDFSALVGTEMIQSPSISGSVIGRLFPSDDFSYISSAGVVDVGSSGRVKSGLLSFFSESKYNIKDKYLFSLAIRADGSSRFGPGNRFGYFPAASAAWRITEESFFQSKVIEDLKIKASIGYTGNERIGDFRFLGAWASVPYNGTTGISPSNIANPDLKWETTREINVGADISLFGGRIQSTLEAYLNKTTDLLFGRPYASTTGFSSVLDNIGDIQNKGIEFGITSVNLDGAIKWTTEINLSKNINKILYLADSIPIYTGYTAEGVSATNVVQQGQPLGTFIGLNFLGVNPATGNAIYEDRNKDGKITNDDQMIIGHALPKLTGGVTNRFVYGSFDLNVFFQFSVGNQVLNMTKAALVNSGKDLTSNQSIEALRRWQKPGDITDVPRYIEKNTFNNFHSNRLIEDGSFLRLKNLGVGYTLPVRISDKLMLNRLRVYATSTNLWTFTKYSGADPEVSTLDGSTTAQGIDFFTLPQVKTVSLGLNATLK